MFVRSIQKYVIGGLVVALFATISLQTAVADGTCSCSDPKGWGGCTATNENQCNGQTCKCFKKVKKKISYNFGNDDAIYEYETERASLDPWVGLALGGEAEMVTSGSESLYVGDVITASCPCNWDEPPEECEAGCPSKSSSWTILTECNPHPQEGSTCAEEFCTMVPPSGDIDDPSTYKTYNCEDHSAG